MYNRAAGVLLILLAATAITAVVAWPVSNIDPIHVSIATVGIAAFKIRMIAFEFMEVSNAPLVLRVFVTSWIAIVTATLMTLYCLGRYTISQ